MSHTEAQPEFFDRRCVACSGAAINLYWREED